MNRAIRIALLKTCLLLPVLLMASGIASCCAFADHKLAAVAVGDLFESDVLADNAFGLRQAAKGLPAEARYELLKSHVLPGKLHREFRLIGKLTPTDPPKSAVSEHPVDVARVQVGAQLKQNRIRTGGIFVSPVFELIDAAKETGRLDELRFAVQSATAQGEVQQRCQYSLLAMIAIAKGDLNEAARSTDELYNRFVKQRFDRLQDRMPETLLLWMAAEQGVLLDEALLFLASIQDSQIRVGKSHGPTEWDVLMIHLIGWIQHQKLPPEERTQPWTAAPDLKSWHWVTRSHSWSNGLGMPPGHIQSLDGAVDVFAKQDDEFLMFTSPLRGNYTLECLCTGFGWKEIHPLINGTWITPVWHQLEADSSGVTQIVGHRSPELSGTGTERLLRYFWPLVWDSEVTYEFFWEDGKSIVHPALGRRAFLIERTGVRTHDTTNGVWEAASIDPLNQSASGSRVEIDSLPLKSGEWNRVTVQISGDVVRLRLNDVLIHESDIAATNDRSFGLFYYCDQSEARVRNVVLKGDWPKLVPPVAEQELRGTQTDVLDCERDALAGSFEFDFTKTTAKEVLSTFAESFTEPTSIALLPSGLQMSGTAKPKGQSTSVAGPRIVITGDFDVIAEFSDLKIKASDNGVCAIYLGPRVIQKEFEAHLLFRGMVQHPDTPLRELTQVEVQSSGAKGFRYEYPVIYADECRSGRLRVARRGTTWHYLIAPLDSENFRLLHSMAGSDIPILSGNFMLRISCYSAGVESSDVSVVWKTMSVRAETIENARTSVPRNLYLLDLRKIGSVDDDVTKITGPLEPIRQLTEPNPEYVQMKWPTWSHDGKFIIYEMNNGQYSVLSRITLGDSQKRPLAIGTLPSLSPDGAELVITNDARGVSIIPSTGGNVVARDLDPVGISGAWSPDGRSIAWISSKRIVVLDVKNDQRRVIPAEDQPLPYRAIEKGLGWSRDSKSLAFKATLLKDQGDAVAIVVIDLEKPDKLDVLCTGVRLHSDVSWHPDGNQVLFSGLDPATETPQMFIVKRDDPEKLIPVPGQPRNWRIIDCDWSPDGYEIAFTAEPPP